MKMDLRVRSPTHIGSGDELSRQEYQFDNGQAFVPDVRAYFREHPNEIDGFVTAMERNEPVDHAFDDGYSRYTLDSWVAPSSIRGVVSVALKDGSDVPYIPGTSLKGWIRTALAYRALSNGASLHRVDERAIEGLFRGGEGEPTDDLLRCVTVRDAYSSSAAELALCEIKTYSLKRSGELREKRWSNYAECLLPGTEFTTDVSVNEALLRRLIDAHDGDATRVFGEDLTEQGVLATISEALVDFQAAVIREDRQLIDDGTIEEFYSGLSKDDPSFRLGFGTGHHSKTVSLALSETDRIRANAGNGLKHAACGGNLKRDRYSDEELFCLRCHEGGIRPNFDNVIRFPKTRRFVICGGSPEAPLGWTEASLRGPL